MNFKKMLAGTFAGIVATTAVATAASAATVQQEAFNETINVKSYKASWTFDIGRLNVVSQLKADNNRPDTNIVLKFPVGIDNFALSFTGNTATGNNQTITVSPKPEDDNKKFTFDVLGTATTQGYSNTQTLNLSNFIPDSAIDMNMKGTINHGYEYLTEAAAKDTSYAKGTAGIFKYKKVVDGPDVFLNSLDDSGKLKDQTLSITPSATATYKATGNKVVADPNAGTTVTDYKFYPASSYVQNSFATQLDNIYGNQYGYLANVSTVSSATSERVEVGNATTATSGTAMKYNVVAFTDANGNMLYSKASGGAIGNGFSVINGAGAALVSTNPQPSLYGQKGDSAKVILDKLTENGSLIKFADAKVAADGDFTVVGGAALKANDLVTAYVSPVSVITAAATHVAGQNFTNLMTRPTGTVTTERQDFTISLVANANNIATGIAANSAGQFNRQIITTQTIITKQDYVTVGGKKTATDKDVDTVKSMDQLVPGLQVHLNDVLGNTKGSTITFNFVADANYEDYLGFNWDYDLNKMFGIRTNNATRLQLTGYANEGSASLTFDWDTILQNSGLTINSTGLLVDTIVSTNGPDLKLKVDSITIDVPENSFNDLSAGEGTVDSADDITPEETTAPEETVAPVVTDAVIAPVETTVAAVNPSTGNAPIALAVIPVAIAAAAIIAKKRG